MSAIEPWRLSEKLDSVKGSVGAKATTWRVSKLIGLPLGLEMLQNRSWVMGRVELDVQSLE